MAIEAMEKGVKGIVIEKPLALDMANFLLGTPPMYVLAGAQVTDKRIYEHAAEDASIIFAEYPEGRSATFCTGPMSGYDVRLIGNEGSAFCKEDVVVIATADGVERIPFEELPGEKSFAPLMDELMAAMDGGSVPLCSLELCASATEMAYAAHESALSNVGPRRVDAETTMLKPEHLEGIDAIIIYHTQKEADETTRQLLEEWVASGKQLCVTHAGLGAWPEWQSYQAWCGFVWEWGVSIHPHSPATLRPAASGQVDFGFSEAWLPRDEVFIRLKETSPVVLDLTAEISGAGTYPAAWHLKDQPNVAVWMPGHRRDSWEVPAMRQSFESVLKGFLAHGVTFKREKLGSIKIP